MIRNVVVILIILTTTTMAFAGTRFSTDERVAIIGAGASGLTAAFHLRQLGYENITVYEKENRVGGKVYSYSYDDFVFELGAFWADNRYSTVLEMADYYGIEAISEDINMIVAKADGNKYSIEENLLENYNFMQISWALLNFEWVRARFGYDVKKVGNDNVHPDLYIPFEKFVKKYHLGPLAYAFRPFWIGCGYGYYETTPAFFVLKLMVPLLEGSQGNPIKNIVFPSKRGILGDLLRFPNGYMSIYENVAADVQDLRLNSEVTRVERVFENGKLVIRITANGQTDEFDKTIISTDLRAALKFLDVTDEELALFSQVKSNNFYLYLVEADGVNYPPNSAVWFDEYGTVDTIGHMTGLGNRGEVPYVWTTAHIIPWGTSSEEVTEWMRTDVASVGGEVSTIIAEQAWDYFPHVSEESLRDGFYEKMDQIQGWKGTYFVGGVLNFEAVEFTSVFAKNLVLNNF